MKDRIFEIMVGAFKRSLIVSDMVEMNKIAKGIDHVTCAYYMEFVRWLRHNCTIYSDGKNKKWAYMASDDILYFDDEGVYQHWKENINNK
ncbi:MAG TPA: hypothetical protein VMV77_04640 [Bacteroidales bacterium]|nr:hypothetical protein [Bacteroidales bacterium]